MKTGNKETPQRGKQNAGEKPVVELREVKLGKGRVCNSRTGPGSTAGK